MEFKLGHCDLGLFYACNMAPTFDMIMTCSVVVKVGKISDFVRALLQ